jgi:hypothetical protein
MATSAGLVSVTTGSLVVSGNLTAFVAAEVDQFILRGITAVIQRAISPSQLQLARPWPGPDIASAADWDISLTSPNWSSTVVTNRRLTDLLNQFEAGPIKPDAAGPFSERSRYNDQGVGFIFLSTGEPWTLYTKLANTGSASDWSPGQAIRGSPAESTVEAQAARDDAALSAGQASGAAGTAQTAAALASGHAATALDSAAQALARASAAEVAASLAAANAGRIGTLLYDMGDSLDLSASGSKGFDFGDGL